MARTPDRIPGPSLEEETRYDTQTEDPTVDGSVRYVSGSFRLKDSLGVFNPRPVEAQVVAVEDEGSQIIASVSTLNFTGNNVTAAVDGTDPTQVNVEVDGGVFAQAKSGTRLAATFSSKRSVVTFVAPFPDTNYGVTLCPNVSNDSTYALSYRDKTANGFTIFTSSASVSNLIAVDWVAVPYGEG